MSLIERTLYGTINKPETAIERIKAFEEQALSMHPDGYYVAFGGGKDSETTLDLVRKSGVKHTVHFHITTVDPPELIRFIRKHYPGITWERPAKTMWQLIVEKMSPPTRIIRYCCEALKEGGGDGRMVITGIRWAESVKRAKRRMVESCQRKKNKMFLHPIIDWKDEDVWEYIKSYNLPYCELYDQGFKRIGCIGCPMSGDARYKEFARWPKYEKLYRRSFAAAAAANRAALGIEYGGKGRLAKLRWTDGDDMFRWWMNENSLSTNDDQMTLFG